MTIPVGRLPRMTAAGRKRYEAAAEGKGGEYLLEGEKAVLDALARPGVSVLGVALADDLAPDAADEVRRVAGERRVPLCVAPRRELDRASDVVAPQGVLALVADAAVSPEAAVSAAEGPVVLLEGVQDPGNVGAAFRSAAALGAGAVLVAGGTADPLRAKALRASAGAALAVPFSRAPLDRCLAAVDAAGLPLWLLDARGDDLFALPSRPSRFALAVGSEGRGASEALEGAAVARLSIPLARGVESLNAAVALSVALSRLVRLPVAEGARPRGGARGRGPR